MTTQHGSKGLFHTKLTCPTQARAELLAQPQQPICIRKSNQAFAHATPVMPKAGAVNDNLTAS
eukprot:1478967-Amphidinium_carterae.2